MTHVAVTLLLLGCLFEGSLCQEWAAIMPSSVEGLGGSCVRIPCRFTMASGFEAYLDDTCRAIWRRGRFFKTEVFDSSRTGESTSLNLLQGNLTGSLKDQDCTTILHNMQSDKDSDSYYFRLDCDNALKFNFGSRVLLYIQDSALMPAVKADRTEVEEGDTLKLVCSAPAPCPMLPPVLTWAPALGFFQEMLEESRVTLAMEVSASYLHNMMKVTCTALHRRQGVHDDLHAENSLTLHVAYTPKNTSVSFEGPVTEGSSVTLTCNTDANPAADSYTWYQVDQAQVTPVGFAKRLSITVTEATNTFYCRARNRYGSQNSSSTRIDVHFPPKETAVIVEPAGLIVEGASVVLLCQSRAKPPVSNYMWSKDGQEHSETGAVLLMERVEARHSGDYRCKASNMLGEESSTAVHLDVQYPPRNTSVTFHPSGPVPDGSTVTLRCASMANPAEADVTWYRLAAGKREAIGAGQEISFNVSKLSEDQFYCQAANIHGLDSSEPVSIDVTFRPEILASSHCEDVSSQTRCSCDSRANPPPAMYWELSGATVNHSAITEVPLEGLTTRSIVTLFIPDQDQDEYVLSLVCFSVNPLGLDSLVFNMSSTGIEKGEGFCDCKCDVPCAKDWQFDRKTKGSFPPSVGQADNASHYLVTNESNSAHVNAIYTNQAAPVEEDQLHYADVNLAKLQAKSVTESEIRGLSSMTGEYAEIRLRSTGNDGEVVNTHAGQKEMNGSAANVEAPASLE
uniref:B-cell receptor CD22 isoform X2 n=1 Tax=Doryrhamphus excisus TaxID=161450 RepID=UPI0025AEA131|nr:B-cell receptor CD22 isoform X2 [Doryrhamphus excisus]